jgi:hypothetical protein
MIVTINLEHKLLQSLPNNNNRTTYSSAGRAKYAPADGTKLLTI